MELPSRQARKTEIQVPAGMSRPAWAVGRFVPQPDLNKSPFALCNVTMKTETSKPLTSEFHVLVFGGFFTTSPSAPFQSRCPFAKKRRS